MPNTPIFLRKKYWIIRARQNLKRIIRDYAICERYNFRPIQQAMAPLRTARIEQTLYERLVQTVKLTLRKVLGRALQVVDELVPVLSEIESVINHRNLAYIQGDNPHKFCHLLIS